MASRLSLLAIAFQLDCSTATDSPSTCKACVSTPGNIWGFQGEDCFANETEMLEDDATYCQHYTAEDVKEKGMPANFAGGDHATACCESQKLSQCQECVTKPGNIWGFQGEDCFFDEQYMVADASYCQHYTAEDVKEKGMPTNFAGAEHAKKCCESAAPSNTTGKPTGKPTERPTEPTDKPTEKLSESMVSDVGSAKALAASKTKALIAAMAKHVVKENSETWIKEGNGVSSGSSRGVSLAGIFTGVVLTGLVISFVTRGGRASGLDEAQETVGLMG